MKKIYLFIFGLFLSLIFINDIEAASSNISVTANKSTVIVGETVTVTVKVSSSSYLGSWTFDVIPSSNLSYVSSTFGGMSVRDVVDSSTQTSKTYTYTFKAKSSGTASVSIKNATVYGYDEAKMATTLGSKKFTLMTYAELQATYSKNNYLANLSVEGHSLSPIFNKETLEYNLELENGTESIKISATKDDSRSTIKGIGTISLQEGMNTINIVVTAQNGNVRTYTINANVKELSPIEVKVNGATYSVIRKKELMPLASTYYEDAVAKINKEEVPAYYNEATKFTLVGLRDSSGNSKLFIYENGTFKPYNEISFNSLSIYFLDIDPNLIPEGYTVSKLNIGDYSLVSYIKEGYEYPLVYGMNVETGKTNLYKYDNLEKTLQRYETVEENNQLDLYFYIIIGLFGFIVLTYIIFFIVIINKNKKLKRITKKIDVKEDNIML